jgi:hypothetical protein
MRSFLVLLVYAEFILCRLETQIAKGLVKHNELWITRVRRRLISTAEAMQ